MKVITPAPDRTVTTPNASMESLATPSRGSTALSTWRVRMDAGRSGPVHVIDREQVWMVISGSLTVTCDGRTETAAAGQAVLLPSGVPRRLGAAEGTGAVEALVAMEAGGSAVTEDGARHALPWAE
ncbi:cupin [Streptomyces sp. CNQ-509]|uniref:cupin domain-containing protein n=1 Tax=unclassified Streptomyces TaxID=2593676 RepID=UPI00062DE7EE|nr:cupin domain-containing protein [Streptomyces sp. CNQ-509]AKH83434.1 cupin [Streptomyces sp. CNQ-509]